MGEVIFWLVVGVIGFIIGGIYGEIVHHIFLEYALMGLCVVWGIPIVASCHH